MKKIYQSILFSLLSFSGFNLADAQVNLYKFSQSNGTYTPITGGTVLGTATSNVSAGNLNSDVFTAALPFAFKFNDVTYNDVHISSNGFITFGVAPSTTNTTPISNTAAYAGAVSVFGRDICSFFDLASTTGSIVTNVVGIAPNREFVIEWKNFRPTSTTSATAVYSMSFQIRLKETSNGIDMVYGPGSQLLGTTTYSSTVQIGLRGSSSADFINRTSVSSQAFAASEQGTEDDATQYFSTSSTSTAGMPASGLTYSWNVPTCYPPTNLTASNITANGALVSWQAPAVAPGSYELYYSTNYAAPTSATPATITGITTTSQPLSGLQSFNSYFTWVRSVCGTNDKSNWAPVPVITTLCVPTGQVVGTGATVCLNGMATLAASGVSGATYKWYDAATGGNPISSGTTFTTPALTATTNYYVSSYEGEEGYAGKLTPSATSGNTSVGNYGLVFDSFKPFKIHAVDVYPMKSASATSDNGTMTFELLDGSNAVLATKTVNVVVNSTTVGNLNTVDLGFDVPAGNNFKLNVSAKSSEIGNIRREITSNMNYPYVFSNIFTINASNFSGNPSTSYYYYIYNWKVSSGCESARVPVTATVDTNCLSTSESEVKNGLNIYPNPFTDVVNITNYKDVKSLSITDASGRMVKMFDHVHKEINLADLKAGMYIFNISLQNGTSQSVKVIKK